MKSSSVGLAEKQYQKELEYWEQKLSGELVVTGIPFDFKRPHVIGSDRETVELAIDPETQGRLRKLCDGNELLVFTACATALKICLYEYTRI